MNKNQILKIAKVKNIDEFYRKFPTEEAFMKAHKKEFKKVAMGAAMVKKQLTQLTDFANPPQAQIGTYIGGEQQSFQPVDFKKLYNQTDRMVTGMDDDMRMEQANLAAQQAQAANAGKGGLDIGNLMQGVGNIAQMAEMLEHGGYIQRAQVGSSISQFGPQLASQRRGQIQSPTGQVTRQQTEALGFKSDGSNYGANKFSLGMQNFGKSVGEGYNKLDSSLGKIGGVSGGIGIGKDLIQGFQQLKQEKEQKRGAEQMFKVSGLVSQAASTRPEQVKRKYVRPEDMLVQPGEVGNAYGTGYSPLQMEDGGIIGQIGGNPTEIQNMYNPGSLYDNLGYEPLDESSDQVKQFYGGGYIPKAQFGIDKMAGQAGSTLGSLIGGGKGRPTAGGQIGSTIGSTVGKFIPVPGASAILGGVGGLVGGILGGKSAKQTADWEEQSQENMMNAAMQQGVQGVQNQYSGFMKDGGGLKYLSHDWQPQLITQFGGYDLKDLLAPPKDADMLRAGGEIRDIRSNYMGDDEKLSMMQMGGELQTYWGGDAETISQNPYLPDGGETVMFRGQSHDESDGQGRTGIGITFGDSPVEVERGEPAVKLKDGGTGDDSLVVFGNMKIPSYGVSELNDPKAKGKKFKTYVNDLSKLEEKANKTSDKAIDIIDNVDGSSKFDALSMSTAEAMMMGSDMALKEIAMKKQLAAGIQNAILDTAEELGVESDALAKGKIKQAKAGGKFSSAQVGRQVPPSMMFSERMTPVNTYNYLNPNILDRMYNLQDVSDLDVKKPAPKTTPTTRSSKAKTPPVKETPREMVKLDMPERRKLPELTTPTNIKSPTINMTPPPPPPPSEKESMDLMDLYQSVYPYIRPDIRNPLDPTQLMPEMLALSMNQLEPVQAQLYKPMLEQVAKVSFQDRLNEIQADANASKRLVGNNPAALSAIDAQVAQAKNQVLGEQFRTNQMLEMESRRKNLATLNDATLKNLSILDQQFTRQAGAKSATKAQAFEALSGIADKIARNKAETLSANVTANMYPQYTFGPKGRIFNTGLTRFNIPQVSGYSAAELQSLADARKVEESKKKTTARNGSIVKAIKNL